MNHEFYMRQALEQAKIAVEKDEVPVGAVVVDAQSGEIIACTHNLTEHAADATAHAEILCIQEACRKLKSNRLRGFNLYVTLEPCTMCAAAISFARIETLYIGTPDPKGGAVLNGVKFYEAPTCHHRPKVESGFLADECSQILKDFFRAHRTQRVRRQLLAPCPEDRDAPTVFVGKNVP